MHAVQNLSAGAHVNGTLDFEIEEALIFAAIGCPNLAVPPTLHYLVNFTLRELVPVAVVKHVFSQGIGSKLGPGMQRADLVRRRGLGPRYMAQLALESDPNMEQ